MAKLAVFDIDGTLCDTNFVDDACFAEAVAAYLAVEPTQIDWSDAPHITDSGLLDWLCVRFNRPAPADSDIEVIVARFLSLLEAEATSAPDAFRPIPGARQALLSLKPAGWDLAIATGGWERCAVFKLSRIGIATRDVALATADDAITRADIIQTAVHRAELRYSRRYTRVVSIGDAVWDVRTAAELALPFIGIAHAERAQRLRRLGATSILENLTDLSALHRELENASPPSIEATPSSA